MLQPAAGGIPHQHDLQSALAQLSPVVLPWYFSCLLLLAASLPAPQLHCWGMLQEGNSRELCSLLRAALSCLAFHTGLRTEEVWAAVSL